MNKERGTFSRRSYPPRRCAGRYCNKSFTPHDSRAIYCCAQCGQNERNDRKKDKYVTDFTSSYYRKETQEEFIGQELKKALIQYTYKLEEIRCNLKERGVSCISTRELALNGINLSNALFYEETRDYRRIYYFLGHLLLETTEHSNYFKIKCIIDL